MIDCHNFLEDDSLIACFILKVGKYFVEIVKTHVFTKLVPELQDLLQFIFKIRKFL